MNLFYSKYYNFLTSKQLLIVLLLGLNMSLFSQNVNVTATSGTLTGSYVNLNSVFTAINNGTHKGTIVLTIVGNTTEPVIPVPLLAAGGLSSYTSILIKPSGNRTVSGAPNPNRSLIELFGADNVTIDGRDPDSVAGSRNLTFNLSTTGSSTAAVHLGSTGTTGADGADFNTIKNCIILGARANSVNVTNTYGIVVSSNSITTITSAGQSCQGTLIENDSISRVLIGIQVFGQDGFPMNNTIIRNNKIGVTTNSNNNVGKYGIWIDGTSESVSNGAIIEGNEIVVGLDNSSGYALDCVGILLWDNTVGTVIRYNYIHDIINTTTSTTNYCAGIQLDGFWQSNNIDVNNNFIRDVIGRKKTTTDGFCDGILVTGNSNSNLKINFNTIALIKGNIYGTTVNYSNSNVAFLSFSGTTNLLEFKNNILYNANIGTGTRGLIINNPSINIGTATMDKNCYYIPNGTYGATNLFYYTTLNAWQLANLRDMNSFVEKPNFKSTTDIHIKPNVVTKLESNADAVLSPFDIDREVRPMLPATISDIGADEFNGIAHIPSKIIFVGHSDNTTPCVSVPRTIVANIEKGNSDTAVYLSYKYEGGAFTNVKMTNTSGNFYSYTIPAAFPSFNQVTYRVFLVDSLKGDTVSSNYNYYNDLKPEGAYMPTFTSDPMQACIGSPITLTYSIPANSTLFNAAPKVSSPTNLADVDSVSVGTLVNMSSLNTLNGSIGTPTGIAGAYSNYTALRTDSFEIAKSYPMALSTATNGVAKNYLAAYVDLNGDGDFADAGENIYNTVYVDIAGARTEKGNLFIPRSAKPGKTVLRIIASNNPITSPTAPINFGETEDYSIYIKPLIYQWVINSVDASMANPYTYTINTLPTTINLKIKDSFGCSSVSSALNITASPSTMSVSIIGTSTGCINEVRKLYTSITGGCSPFTYSWSNGTNTSSNTITLQGTSNTFSVTVTDKNGLTASSSISVSATDPQPLTVDSGQVICNRGTTLMSATSNNSDSILWFSNPATSVYDYMGKQFTTPLLSTTTTFYVAAMRSSADSSGRLNISTTTTTFASFLDSNSGLAFTTTKPIRLQKCAIYGAGTGVTLNIGVKDRSGTIIAQTGNISVTMAASATTATIVNLNLDIPIPDSGYQLILLSYTGLTTLNRNSSGHTYPISPTKPMIITGGVNFGNFNHPNYYYFYNIKYSLNACVGLKSAVRARVTAPRVPKIYKDAEYTLLCKGDTAVLPIISDTFGNIYKLYKKYSNGGFVEYFKLDTVPNSINAFAPPRDSLSYNYKFPVFKSYYDTGDYYLVISSSRFCTRDTFTRTVKISYHPEVNITSDLKDLHLCVGTKGSLVLGTDIGKHFTWYKNNVYDIFNYDGVRAFDTVKFSDSGTYHVIVNDSFNCKAKISDTVKLYVHEHPSVTPKTLDTAVICEDGRYTIKHLVANYTDLQWYKDGGLVPYFTKDSFLVRNALISDSGKYHLEVKSYPGCNVVYTTPTQLVVNPKPVLLINPFNLKFCEGNRMSLYAKYKNAKSIEWYKDNFNTGLVSDSFVAPIAALSDSGKYKFNIIGYNQCPNLFSTDIKVEIAPKPSITSLLPNQLICEDSELKLSFNTKNIKYYQWIKNGVDVQTFTDSILYFKFTSILDTGLYQLRANSDPVCTAVKSSPFRINISEKPKIVVQPIGDTLCAGVNYTLTTQNIQGLTYQWKRNGVNIPGATNTSYTINGVGPGNVGNYNLFVTGKAPCPAVMSDTAKVAVKSGATNSYVSEVSIYDAVEQCTDDKGWTYYANEGSEDKFIFAVRKNGNTFTSKADVIVRPSTFQNISNTKNGFTGTYMLKRMWNLKLNSGTISNPIDVKFYVNLNEVLDLDKKVQDLKNLHENSVQFNGSDLIWFKTPDTVPFTNQLLNNVKGDTLNFPYKVIAGVNTGKDGATDYYEFSDIDQSGGGTGMKQFTGITKFVTAISNANQSIEVSLLPNPNDGNFELDITTPILKNINCKIYNSIGQVVYDEILRHKVTNARYKFNVEHLPSGNYHIMLENEEILKSIKLQIVK